MENPETAAWLAAWALLWCWCSGRDIARLNRFYGAQVDALKEELREVRHLLRRNGISELRMNGYVD